MDVPIENMFEAVEVILPFIIKVLPDGSVDEEIVELPTCIVPVPTYMECHCFPEDPREYARFSPGSILPLKIARPVGPVFEIINVSE